MVHVLHADELFDRRWLGSLALEMTLCARSFDAPLASTLGADLAAVLDQDALDLHVVERSSTPLRLTSSSLHHGADEHDRSRRLKV